MSKKMYRSLVTPAEVDLGGGVTLRVRRDIARAQVLVWLQRKSRLLADNKLEVLELQRQYLRDVWPRVWPTIDDQGKERPPEYISEAFIRGSDTLCRDILRATALALEGVEVEGLDLTKPEDIIAALDYLDTFGLVQASTGALNAQSPSEVDSFSSESS